MFMIKARFTGLKYPKIILNLFGDRNFLRLRCDNLTLGWVPFQFFRAVMHLIATIAYNA